MRKVLFLILFLLSAVGMDAQLTTHFVKIDGRVEQFSITRFLLETINNQPYLSVTNEIGNSLYKIVEQKEPKETIQNGDTITICVFDCIDNTGRAKHHFVQYLPKNLTGKKIIIKDYITIGERKMPCITYSSTKY